MNPSEHADPTDSASEENAQHWEAEEVAVRGDALRSPEVEQVALQDATTGLGTASSGLRRSIERLLRMYRKELRETLRDRRTIITLLVMPLLLYPILSMALNRFLLSVNVAETGYTVCLETPEELERLAFWLSDPRSSPPQSILESRGGELAEFRLGLCQQETVTDSIQANEADVGVKIDFSPQGKQLVSIYSHRGDNLSENAKQILVERLHWLSQSDATLLLRSAVPQYRSPLEVSLVEVGEPPKSNLLATLIPLVLVLMTITGAVYPAIDLTAGERERGTLEAVMASPVPRYSVLIAKYLAVISVACLTALANLIAMFTTLWGSGLIDMIQGDGSSPLGMILPMLALLILFSLFFSAVLLSLTSFARSFKEAQAYLIPVMLVSLAPAMVSLVPGIELAGVLLAVPLVNIVLLARDLLSGDWSLHAATISVVVTLFYAASALSVAAKLFGSDAVMRTSEQSIASLFRRNLNSVDRPSFTFAALVLALLIPSYFVVSNGLMLTLREFGESLGVEFQLALNGAALIVTFGLLPFFAALWQRTNLRKGFRLRSTKPLCLIGSIFLGLGCWAFAHEAFVFADTIGIGGLGESQIEAAQQMIEKMRSAPIWLLLAVFALCPGVVEELCFRGYFFRSLERDFRPYSVVLITAILFGLFHVITGNALLIERLIPSTLMGLVIGWVALRTGSVLPGMVIHFVHNALLNLVLYYQEQLDFLGEGFDDQTHLPPLWILLATCSVFLGGFLIHFSSKKHLSLDH